jgi:hypothetical protein
MTRALERCAVQPRPRRKSRPNQDELYRDRVMQHHLARIENAETPVDHAREAGGYLVDLLRFVADADQAWAVAHLISRQIRCAADGLSEHVRRGGRQ